MKRGLYLERQRIKKQMRIDCVIGIFGIIGISAMLVLIATIVY